MTKIKFKIAVKTDVGLVRTNNEDNFQASSDLLVTPMRWVNNEVCQLGEKGALLVVADGMGGMNAGEVASQIAIDTVREEFTPEHLKTSVTQSRFSIEKFMNDVVVKADNKIKETAKLKPETKGMGTTIVIAWLYEDTLYVTWCGDSRAYVFNPKLGLHRLTKDHSYVQQLVDAGKLTEEEAFDFPDSNIITRCLSASPQKARPESLAMPYKVCDNDVILLCTDGLCGMIGDAEIQSIIESNVSDISQMNDRLVQGALDASGADNVTICLCQIISGGGNLDPNYFVKNNRGDYIRKKVAHFWNRYLKIILLCLCFLAIGGFFATFFLGRNAQPKDPIYSGDSAHVKTDSVANESLSETLQTEEKDTISESLKEIEEKRPKGLDNNLNGINIPNTDNKEKKEVVEGDNPINSLTRNSSVQQQIGEEELVVREKMEYMVHERETAYAIMRKFNMTRTELESLNPNIPKLNEIKAGDIIIVYKN
jgi:serine/threonine protein phosphatase PrpC